MDLMIKNILFKDSLIENYSIENLDFNKIQVILVVYWNMKSGIKDI